MFQIVLLENNKKIKVLHTYSRLYDANYRFNLLARKSTSMPKKVMYKDKTLTQVSYRILLMKHREKDEKSITIRDEYGKVLDDLMSDSDWIILSESIYNIEEQFNVTGANRKLTSDEIIKYVILPKLSESNTKQVLILNNRLIVEGDLFNLITCKSNDEAIRLYNIIRIYCFDNKIKNIMFFGSVQNVDKRSWYKKIHNLTGISYNRLYRKITR
jgi:hypothetical protein